MNKLVTMFLILIFIQVASACSVENIEVTNLKTQYQIDINTTGCTTENIDVFKRDLLTLEDTPIYSGEITSEKMTFYIENYQPGINKIYANINEENFFTILRVPVPTSEKIVRFEDPESSPTMIEYNDININFLGGKRYFLTPTILDQQIGFYFEINDFNIIWQETDYNFNAHDLPNYEKPIYYYTTDFDNVNEEIKITISKLKYNDTITIFAGTLDNNDYARQTVDINAKPFTTITNSDFNFDTNNLEINYAVYNSYDVNNCSLLVDNNNVQTNNTVLETNNNIIINLTSGNYLIDINCITNQEHYRYNTSTEIITNVPYPEIDNIPFLSDNPTSINILWPFVKNDNNYLEINSCNQLNYVANYPNENFILTNDLDCSGVELNPIETLNGLFDGNTNTISNISINLPSEDNIGLFKTLDGNIINLEIIDANIIGKNNVGIIAGTNNGKINQVHTTGFVKGILNAGGIVGLNNANYNSNPYNSNYENTAPLAEINNSHSEAIIDANISGGIAGYNKGKIEKTFFIGSVNASSYQGGIAGVNHTQCYSYQHYIDSGIIKDSFSFGYNAGKNSCYSHWYYGSVNEEIGTIINSTSHFPISYLGNISNPPFNTWDFNNIWKKGAMNPVLIWEQ